MKTISVRLRNGMLEIVKTRVIDDCGLSDVWEMELRPEHYRADGTINYEKLVESVLHYPVGVRFAGQTCDILDFEVPITKKLDFRNRGVTEQFIRDIGLRPKTSVRRLLFWGLVITGSFAAGFLAHPHIGYLLGY